MLNHITIMGRLTRDPEIRRTGSGIAVTNFTVAVDRDYPNKETGEKETDFINCVAWRHKGEFVSKYFTKGSMIVVSGRLQIKKWVDRNEVTHYDAEIVADEVYFGESKRDKDPMTNVGVENTSYTGEFSNYGSYASADSSFLKFYDDDDDGAVLPF